MPRKEPRVRVERGLYKSGDTYIACVTPPGEKRERWKSLGKVGLTRARVLRDEFAAEIRSGRAIAGGRAVFADAAKDFLAYCDQLVAVDEMAPRTREAYGTAVNSHLVPYFKQRDIRKITPDLLVAWHAEQRTSGASPWSIKGRWNVLRQILARSARQGVIAVNPCDLLTSRERPKAGEARVRFLTDTEIRQLLSAAHGRYRVLIATGLFTGVRISECLGLRWEHIDFDAEVIRVRSQLGRDNELHRLKTGAGVRDIVMMAELARILRRYRLDEIHTAQRDAVFGTATHRTLSQRNATRAFESAVTRAGLVGVTFHTLRHTFASILIAQGRDPVFVADQLGHADVSETLRTYAHLFRAAKQAQATRDQLDSEYGQMLRDASAGDGTGAGN